MVDGWCDVFHLRGVNLQVTADGCLVVAKMPGVAKEAPAAPVSAVRLAGWFYAADCSAARELSPCAGD